MKKILLIMMFGLFLTLAACSSGSEKITPQEAKNMLEQNTSVVLLDVRTREEFNQEHIPGAILIPLNVLQRDIQNEYPNLNQTFIVYCRSGNRSQEAIEIMRSLGYKNLYDLGGIIDWPFETQSL